MAVIKSKSKIKIIFFIVHLFLYIPELPVQKNHSIIGLVVQEILGTCCSTCAGREVVNEADSLLLQRYLHWLLGHST